MVEDKRRDNTEKNGGSLGLRRRSACFGTGQGAASVATAPEMGQVPVVDDVTGGACNVYGAYSIKMKV